MQQLELIETLEQDDGQFLGETIAYLKYAYYKEGDYYRLVDKREQEGLNHIVDFFNEILLANRLALKTITFEEIANEFLTWMQSYFFFQISEDATLRLALHIGITLHAARIVGTKHRDVTLVLTDNEDRLKRRTLGINAWLRSPSRVPDIQINGKISCTRNTIPLITSLIASERAQCDLHDHTALEINRENFVEAPQG